MKPLVTFLSLFLVACQSDPSRDRKGAVAESPTPVRAAAVTATEWPDTYETTGAVRARSTAILSSKLVAHVQQVSVNVGDRVREGQTLVVLDARDLDAGVRRAEAARAEAQSAIPEADHGIAAAKANLDLAQSTFRRIDELAAKKSVSAQELDEASARLRAAQAAHESVRAKRAQLDSRIAQVDQEIRSASISRDYSRIAAPFDGVVTAKSADPGILAAPGVPLLTIEREGSYRLEVAVEESRLASIRTGQTVSVSLLDRTENARVSEIVPAVDAASRTYIVKIDLPAIPNLRAGVFGRAVFALAARQVVSIPSEALIERGQLQQVFVIEDSQARLRMITTGRRAPSGVEVLSGLTAGEKIVAPVPAGLADGARVEVRP
jgi:multidrug efflux system membrane fusion protein